MAQNMEDAIDVTSNIDIQNKDWNEIPLCFIALKNMYRNETWMTGAYIEAN